jgi:hypothetical protein
MHGEKQKHGGMYMPPQIRDAAIVNELFNENNIDTERSSVVYDDAGHLIKLSLFDASRDGSSFVEFPADFDQLTQLRELYIYVSLTRFPTSICQLTSLRAFVLSAPYPADAFPSEFAQLSNLRYLGLGELKWAHIPPAIWQLRSLRVLDLSWNLLTSLPSEIGQLTQLRFLYLTGNHLHLLPAEIGQLTELKVLSVWPHKLQTLPDEITHLHHLHDFSLSKRLLKSADISRIAHEMGMYIDTEAPALLRRVPPTQKISRYPCMCCGYLTIKESYDICPICGWEADGVQESSPSSETGANTVCLIEARLNFARARVSEDRFLNKVRSPLPEEIPDEDEHLPHMDFGESYA